MDDDTCAQQASGWVDESTVRPLRKDAARNRQLLLDSARVVFAERGLDASLDDVARHAGVGVGTAYRHFSNKYELARAVFTQAVDRMIGLAEQASEMDDPWEAITMFVSASAEAQAADRGLREVVMGVHDDTLIEEINERFNRPLGRLMDRARAAGVIRADVESSDLGMVVMMLCTVGDIAGDQYPTVWRRYLPMLLAGLTGDQPFDEPALTEAEFRDALAAHKRLNARVGGGVGRAVSPTD